MTRNKEWQTPTQQSRDSMSYLVTTSKRTANLQLPHGFLRDGDAPPLARLVQGGRGGEVRLKLYLTVSLIAAAAPHTYDRNTPARSWAELLNLPAPEIAGARRVSDAFGWLHDHKYLEVDRERGRPPRFKLLSMDLEGGDYEKPSREYVAVPLGLWTNHWISALSGVELAVLLAIMDGPGDDAVGTLEPRFLTGVQKRRYGFSSDSWTKATRQLESIGVVEVARRVEGGTMKFRRNRNIYRLPDPQFEAKPVWPVKYS